LETAMTKYAQQILDIVQSSGEHLTAEQVYLRLKASAPKVVLATVYNNLHQLCEQGRIRKVSVEGCPDRYDRITRHDHLVCRRCGALSDIHLSDLTEQLRAQVGEEILSYDLKILYICPACRSREAGEGPLGRDEPQPYRTERSVEQSSTRN